jgi:cytochrome oxidase Cu insertion factor (SCO1/SenC/PrrC family)
MAKPHSKRVRNGTGKFPLIVLLVAAALVLGGYLYSLVSASHVRAPSAEFGSLVDHNGRVFAAAPQTRGYKLVAFGYTHCPDVCPVTLLRVHEVLNALGPQDRRVVPLFVSVDPAHDTVEVLSQYLAAFDPRITGITGSPQALRAFSSAYGVVPQEPAQAGHDELPDHSAMIYLLGPDNTMLGMYAPGDAAKVIAADILRRTEGLGAASARHGEPT